MSSLPIELIRSKAPFVVYERSTSDEEGSITRSLPRAVHLSFVGHVFEFISRVSAHRDHASWMEDPCFAVELTIGPASDNLLAIGKRQSPLAVSCATLELALVSHPVVSKLAEVFGVK